MKALQAIDVEYVANLIAAWGLLPYPSSLY